MARGREWIEGMQSDDGGWAAFDVNNLEYYLNNIPFSDHGALLDPPTEDVTARCISMLSQLGVTKDNPQMARGIEYLRRTQHPEGSWYGRWGMNYVYGTWSVLCALNAAGVGPPGSDDPQGGRAGSNRSRIRTAAGARTRSPTGSIIKGLEPAPTTASQTAWALLALMAAGEVGNPVVARGIEYLIATQTEKGLWDEQRYTATGFPRVFYLRYHGYPKFFPLWALARYRNLEEHQQQGGRGRDVNLGAGDDASAGRVDPRPILIVTGLLQEARIAAGPGMAVICSSSDPQQLRALLTVFDPSTIRGVISFGVAGGLDPSLKSGDVVVATEVMAGDARWLAGLSLSEDQIAGIALGRRRVVAGALPAWKRSWRRRPARPRCAR